ncbi:MAG: hypothetical protein ACXWIQ_06295, partial [Caldimonas sp.]
MSADPGQAIPMPRLRRSSMPAEPWAGPLPTRALRRLAGRGPKRFRRPPGERRPLMLRRVL